MAEQQHKHSEPAGRDSTAFWVAMFGVGQHMESGATGFCCDMVLGGKREAVGGGWGGSAHMRPMFAHSIKRTQDLLKQIGEYVFTPQHCSPDIRKYANMIAYMLCVKIFLHQYENRHGAHCNTWVV